MLALLEQADPQSHGRWQSRFNRSRKIPSKKSGVIVLLGIVLREDLIEHVSDGQARDVCGQRQAKRIFETGIVQPYLHLEGYIILEIVDGAYVFEALASELSGVFRRSILREIGMHGMPN